MPSKTHNDDTAQDSGTAPPNEPAKTGAKAWFGRFTRLIDGGHLAQLSGVQWKTLSVYLRHADNDTGEAFPGAKTIAARIGTDVRHVRRAIRDLERMGFLDTIDRGGRRDGDTARRRVSVPSRAESALQVGGGIGPTSRAEIARGEGGEIRPTSRAESATLTTHSTTQGTTHSTNAGGGGGRKSPYRGSAIGQSDTDQAQVESKPLDPHPGFSAFLANYPPHRRGDRGAALAVWRGRNLEPWASEVLDGLARFRESDQWRREGGRYIPNAEKFLDRDEWEATPEATGYGDAALDALGPGRALTAADRAALYGN